MPCFCVHWSSPYTWDGLYLISRMCIFICRDLSVVAFFSVPAVDVWGARKSMELSNHQIEGTPKWSTSIKRYCAMANFCTYGFPCELCPWWCIAVSYVMFIGSVTIAASGNLPPSCLVLFEGLWWLPRDPVVHHYLWHCVWKYGTNGIGALNALTCVMAANNSW